MQSAPTGQPVSFGPSANPSAIQDAEAGVPNGPQVENLLPLFDDQQLRRFAEIYQQAPMVFPPPGRVVRPDFLERDGKEAEVRRAAGSLHRNPTAAPVDIVCVEIWLQHLPIPSR